MQVNELNEGRMKQKDVVRFAECNIIKKTSHAHLLMEKLETLCKTVKNKINLSCPYHK